MKKVNMKWKKKRGVIAGQPHIIGRWLEEYQHCSCSFVATKKNELPGYCGKHGTDRKYCIRLPKPGAPIGYAGLG